MLFLSSTSGIDQKCKPLVRGILQKYTAQVCIPLHLPPPASPSTSTRISIYLHPHLHLPPPASPSTSTCISIYLHPHLHLPPPASPSTSTRISIYLHLHLHLPPPASPSTSTRISIYLHPPGHTIKAADNHCVHLWDCPASPTLSKPSSTTFTFTFMHLADAFIQSDLHCIQVTVSTFYQLLLSLGIEPMILALLAPCSTSWATGKLQQWADCFRWSCDESRAVSALKSLWNLVCTDVFQDCLTQWNIQDRGVVFQESLTVCYSAERERCTKHKRLVLAEAKTSSVSISMRMCRDGWVCVCSGFTRNQTQTLHSFTDHSSAGKHNFKGEFLNI